MAKPLRIIAKTLSGLEQIAAEELKNFGANNIQIMRRSVQCEGDLEFLYKANLCSRFVGRFLVQLKVVRINTKEDLYKAVGSIDWSDYMSPASLLAIDAIGTNKIFTNSHYVSLLAKDAVVDQFRKRSGRRPSIDTKRPDLRINVHINQNIVSIGLDSSNIPLSKRGYRREGGEAPLSEILAAGIIKLSGWDRKTPFIDGMCGSGTFAIEAALMARNIAPGLIRKSFGFQHWRNYNARLFRQLTEEAKKKINREPLPLIIASDINQKRIDDTLSNAKRAGVLDDLKIDRIAFSDQTPPEEPGVLIMNPPYGERIKQEDLDQLYSSIGDTLKQKYAGYDAFIFSGNSKASKKIGLRTSQKIELHNGQLECRLLKFEMYTGSKKEKKTAPPDNDDAV